MSLDIKTTCSYCGVGCGVRVRKLHDGRLQLTGDDDHTVNHGLLCSKGRYLHHAVMNREERLLYPALRPCRGAPLVRVDWQQAMQRAAAVFRTLINRFGPRSVGMYVSGQMLTEEYYLANKLVKGFWGCNNIDTNSRLCMSSAATAHKLALGDDLVPICYDDIDHADCLLIAGANPAWCHPILFRRIERSKQARPAVRLIVVDPRRTESCELADLHLQIQPGTDVTLYHALARWLIEHDRIDRGFIEHHTEGFEPLREQAMATTLADAAARCRIPVEQIQQAARWIARSRGFLTLWAMGLNQSRVGVDKNLALINLNLLTGQIGRPGAGPFSLTGQPNAMGGREVGGMATLLAAHHDLGNPAHRRKVAEFWGVDQIDDRPGLTATEMFAALERDELKAIWIVCTNPAVSLPNLGKFEHALRRARFVVVQDLSHRSDTTAFADLLLPAAGWLEKAGTMTNSERRVSYLPKLIEPPGEALPDAEIFCRFAQALGHTAAFNYADSAEIFDECAQLTRGMAIDMAGISHARLARQGPLQWPCPTPGHPGTPRLFTDHHFATPAGRARLHTVAPGEQQSAVSTDFPLILTTGRVRDQWHTMTRTGTVGRLRQHAPEPLLEIHPGDAAALAIADNQPLEIHSRDGRVQSRARLTDTIKRGVVFLPMHWGRALGAGCARANNLTSGECDPRSMEPDFKFTAVRVQPIVMPRRRIVVIGGGAASLAFVRCYRALNQRDDLLVLSDEPQPYYNRVLLPELIAGSCAWESLLSCSASELNELGVRRLSGRRIVRIETRRGQWIEDAQGERHAYDVLVLATGSRPRLPTGLPRALPGIFTLRNRHDAEKLASGATPGAQAVILGGGLLGLEAAAALRNRRMRVVVLQRSNRLMRQQLDATAAQMLQEQLADLEIEVMLNDSIDQVIGQDRLRRIRTQAGRHIVCDLLLAAAGIEPNAELGRAAGLEGASGIRVDAKMRSSDPAIYAIGEVAEFDGRCCGTTRAAEAQARVAAAAISGDPLVAYQPVAEVAILKIPGIRLAALGASSLESESPPTGHECLHVIDRGRHYYKKCVIKHDRLVGAILLGDLSELGEWQQYIENGIELEEIRGHLLRGTVASAPCVGRQVCSCHNVGEGNLQQAVAAGCADLDALMTQSRAGTGCGSCRPAVRRLWEACQAQANVTLEVALP